MPPTQDRDGLEHFRHLKQLVRLEEDEENEQVRKEFLDLTPKERQLRGKALLGLKLVERHYSPAEHILATFALPGRRELPLFSLEAGDIVTLLGEGCRTDEFPSGTVYEKTPETLTVAFHQVLPDWVDSDGSYQLHKSVNRVTYKRMLEGLDAVLQTVNTRLAYFRDISIGVKPARRSDSTAGPQFFDPGLNEAQRESVKRYFDARDVLLVHGPPGTGKTTALLEIIRQAVKEAKSVFVTAPSNTACDNILERLVGRGLNALRLGHPARITESLREHTLDFKLALHPYATQVNAHEAELDRLLRRNDRYRERRSPGYEAERELRFHIQDLKTDIKRLRKEIYQQVVRGAEVFVGTPASIGDRSIRETVFDLIVFDEASQATEPLSWIPLQRAHKIVMAGDHFQLPPTVRSKEAEEKGLGVTLFERFHAVLPDPFKVLLVRQYRMHRAIMGFSSEKFYGGVLEADESVAAHTLADLKTVRRVPETEDPLAYIDTAGKGFEERLEEGSESRYNPEEAEVVLGQLRRYLDAGVPASEIAVIAPYSAQVRLLASRTPDPAVEIDSVDGFQGREKELVIVSLVRSNMLGEMGFLNDTRRMNVAMTRARRKLVVIGDSATLSSLSFYRDFIAYAEKTGGYKTIWEIEK